MVESDRLDTAVSHSMYASKRYIALSNFYTATFEASLRFIHDID